MVENGKVKQVDNQIVLESERVMNEKWFIIVKYYQRWFFMYLSINSSFMGFVFLQW